MPIPNPEAFDHLTALRFAGEEYTVKRANVGGRPSLSERVIPIGRLPHLEGAPNCD